MSLFCVLGLFFVCMHHISFILCSSYYYFLFSFFEFVFVPFVCNIFNFRLRFFSSFFIVYILFVQCVLLEQNLYIKCFIVLLTWLCRRRTSSQTMFFFVFKRTLSLLACVNDLSLRIWKDGSATVNFCLCFFFACLLVSSTLWTIIVGVADASDASYCGMFNLKLRPWQHSAYTVCSFYMISFLIM